MAKLTPEQQELRLRLCAHLRRLFDEHKFPTRLAMAEKIGADPGHFSALYNGKTDIGLDIAVQMHRAFGDSLNHLCDDDPRAEYYPPGTRPGMFAPRRAEPVEKPQAPSSASPSAAQPGKRTRRRVGGGRG